MINHDNKQDEYETDHTSVACHSYSLIHTNQSAPNQSTKILLNSLTLPLHGWNYQLLKKGLGALSFINSTVVF